jgi:hypothetical protein
MSIATLRRLWEQQAELNKLVGIDLPANQPTRRRDGLPLSVRRQIADSLRQRWAERREGKATGAVKSAARRKLPGSAER